MKIILTLEPNKTAQFKYDYEKECIRCCESLEKFYNKSDIFIHTFVDDLDKETYSKIKKYNIYNSKFKNELNFDVNFINIYESGKFFQLNLDDDLLHLDLDMILLKKLPEFEEDTIGVYSKCDEEKHREKTFFKYLTNTDFIFTKKDSDFYEDYLRNFKKIENFIKLNFKNIIKHDYEEVVADYIANKRNMKIFQNYELGSYRFGNYDPYFWHEHILL